MEGSAKLWNLRAPNGRGAAARPGVLLGPVAALAMLLSGCTTDPAPGEALANLAGGTNYGLNYPEDPARRPYTSERLGHWKDDLRTELGAAGPPPVRSLVVPALDPSAAPEEMQMASIPPASPEFPTRIPEAQGSLEWQYGLYLASFQTRERAMAGWREVVESQGEALGDLLPVFSQTDLGAEKGRYFRVIAAPVPGLGEARALCRTLEARGQYCRVAHAGGRIEW